ncbi:MAG: hypothetical protein K2L75_03120, partial [Muribaculaceae bacterium]|nr:hypothetical protein [Muribaculaceae bacterium]
MARFHISLLLLFPLFLGCSHHHDEAAEHEDHEHAPGVIVVDEDAAARFGIKVDTLRPTSFQAVVRASGSVMRGGSEDGVVVSPVAGTVHYLGGIEPGASVKAGGAVATIGTDRVSGGDANAAAKAALANAKAEYDRVKELYDMKMATRSELNAARSAYEAAEASYSPSAVSGRAVSPVGGVVTQLLAKEGQYVQAGEAIALTGSATASLLRVDLPLRYAGLAPTFTDMTVDIPGQAVYSVSERGGRRSGTQDAVGQTASGAYLPIYFTVKGSGAAAGTPFTAYLKGSRREGVLTVPVEALSEQQGAYYVYVNTDGHHFVKKPVRVGDSDGMRAEISGVAAGEVIVV